MNRRERLTFNGAPHEQSILLQAAPCDPFRSLRCATWNESSGDSKEYALHLHLLWSLHDVEQLISWLRGCWKRAERESCRGKNSKSGGSDPTFSAFSRPKSSWGRSRPAAHRSLACCAAAKSQIKRTHGPNMRGQVSGPDNGSRAPGSDNWPQAAPRRAATGAKDSGQFLTIREVAGLLQVPVSWIYGRMRKRSTDKLPGYHLGKYWRFREQEVLERVQNHHGETHATCPIRTGDPLLRRCAV
jgi:hypothetical protein